MTTGKLTTLASGFGYVEGIRWHDGAVWFSDLTHNKVRRVGLDGTATEVADVPGTPIGLGWRPDGTLLVASASTPRAACGSAARWRGSTAGWSTAAR